MIKRGPGLPRNVILKTGQHVDGASLCEALKCSRATLHYWRKAFGCPPPVRSGNSSLTDTADVAAWLFKFNVQIFWV